MRIGGRQAMQLLPGLARMIKPKSLSALAGVIALAAVTPYPAMANLVFEGQVVIGGSGFGALPRALTIQSHGPSETTESGCVGPGPRVGPAECVTGSVGGDEAPPLHPKQAAPTLTSLGITNVSQIGILFDGVQPQSANNPMVTIDDLTLKLYNAAGTTLLSTAVLSPEPMTLGTNPGNGMTDYLFGLDAAEAAAFTALIGGNFNDVIALDSTISFHNQSAGPDSYALIDTGTTPMSAAPEPASLAILGSALAGLGLMRRHRRRRHG